MIGFGKTKPAMGDEETESPGVMAGKAFGKAVASGDGASIWEAFTAMADEYAAQGEEPDVDEAESLV